MTFSYRIICGVFAALLSCGAFAQTSAPDAATSGGDAPATTKAQIRAETKAERASNRALSKSVQHAIYQAKGMSDAQISVFATARDGKVILTGLITDEKQEQRATTIASGVPGVKSVSSKLSLYEEGGQ
jgi:hyperosmotically inducible periplasmic protein